MEKIGYSRLIEYFELSVLEPSLTSFLGPGSVLTTETSADGGMEVHYPERYKTDGTWQGHLLFAVKHEGVNPEVLKALFKKADVQEITRLVSASPHSIYVRRIWFLYEFLTGRELAVEPLKTGNYGYALPPDEYFCIDREHSPKAKRQRLFCNLPGNADFCPVVRLSPCIQKYLKMNLSSKATTVVAEYPEELICRAGSFLYLKETKSSYAIERQTPSQRRTAAFMSLLQNAGKNRLDKNLLTRLQNAIVEERYQEKDYRNSQVYVGQTLAPNREMIHFIGLKPEDIPSFMESWISAAGMMLKSSCDAVISAAALSFSFVFIHPFEDGNGRLHRYLLHHILNAKGFIPENIIFPVSALLCKNAARYDSMLENFSRRLMPFVKYHLAENGAMTVINDTADYYRYIDFTRIVEIFFGIVEETMKKELIPELDYLVRRERICSRMKEIADMPDRRASQFILYTRQNGGKFPKRRRDEFPELSDDEIISLQDIVREELPLPDAEM